MRTTALTLIGVLLALACPARDAIAQGHLKRSGALRRRTRVLEYSADGSRHRRHAPGCVRGWVHDLRELMDLTRISAPNYAHLLRAFYQSRSTPAIRRDVIIAVRGGPLDFLLDGGVIVPRVRPSCQPGMATQQLRARALPAAVTGTTFNVGTGPR